jgi:hypothetical protein
LFSFFLTILTPSHAFIIIYEDFAFPQMSQWWFRLLMTILSFITEILALFAQAILIFKILDYQDRKNDLLTNWTKYGLISLGLFLILLIFAQMYLAAVLVVKYTFKHGFLRDIITLALITGLPLVYWAYMMVKIMKVDKTLLFQIEILLGCSKV